MKCFGRFFQFGLFGLLGVVLMSCATANDSANTQLAHACVAESGVTGGFQFNRVLEGNKTTITVPASGRVSPEQSAAINACIAENGSAAVGGRPNYSNAPAGFPTTAQACNNEYRKKLRAARTTPIYTGGGNALATVIGTALGRGIANGVSERRYKECLVRVGATASEMAAIEPSNSRPHPRRESSTVMTGGAGYRTSNTPQSQYTPAAPSTKPSGLPSYRLAERCADASGFTARAQRHPDYKTGKVHATAQELADINRCVTAAGGTTRPQASTVRTTTVRTASTTTPSVPGTMPFPTGFPVLEGDVALWATLTQEQRRRATLFLQTGSTIQSSLQGD